MLDDYSLRLLAEIGIDVYVPRASANLAQEGLHESQAAIVAPSRSAEATSHGAGANAQARIAIVAARVAHEKLLSGIAQALRFAGVPATIVDGDDHDAVQAMRGVVVLGESLARSFAASFSAAQHARLEWVICGEPEAIARNANAKRALWGEIKRVSRRLAAEAPHAGEVR